MWIIDLTEQLSKGDKKNYHYFNPGLVHYHNNIYILTYRIIKYDLPIKYHPWKIWDNNYKYFKNPQAVMQNKYRNDFGKEIKLEIANRDNIHNLPEFDSTGLAFFKFDGYKFELIIQIDNIFGEEMNQDTRIFNDGKKYYISYNIFEKINNYGFVRMRYRQMKINKNNIILSQEKSMFTHKYKSIEKNCVFDTNNNILYHLGRTFDVIINDELVSTPVPELDRLIEYYGEENIFISMGTPPIKYTDKNYLALGHIKIAYKKLMDKYPVNKFLETINFSNIQKHGKFIYFMFFYLFNENYQITKLSNPFIPSRNMNHLPFLLVFPAGLSWINHKIAISYGEGDCRCKLLVLNLEEIEDLLVDKLDLGFYFLANYFDILHYGYFNKLNCGDDAFKIVFKYLKQKYYPFNNLTFTDKYTAGYDLTVLGGGDVINDYFIKPLEKSDNQIVASAGIPYLDKEHYLEKFKYVILRNPRDADRLQSKHEHLTHYPDITFLLPKIINTPVFAHTGKEIGLCLIRNYYTIGYENLYQDFVNGIIKFIQKMVESKYRIHLIPFDINHKKIQENDLFLYSDIKNSFLDNDNVIIEYDETYTNENYVEKTYHKIAQMDFNICSRFHSHIFSTIHKIPFVSLTCGRKCIEYMKDIELTNNLYQMKTNDIDLPIDFDGNDFYQFVQSKIINYKHIQNKLTRYMNIYQKKMENFEKTWNNIIMYYSTHCNKTKLTPSVSQ